MIIMDISGVHHTLSQIIFEYNDNMNYYNHNMRNLINIYERTIYSSITNRENIGNIFVSSSNSSIGQNIQEQRQTAQRQTAQRQTTTFIDNSSNPIYYPNTLRPFESYILNYPFTTINRSFEDVVVRPTNEQILVSTEMTTWNSESTQIQCPISLELFSEGSTICRIRHCRHIFNPNSLMSWFERNVRCPVCRFDIREYIGSYSHPEPVIISPVVPYPDSEDNLSEENDLNNYDDLPELIDTGDSNIMYETTLIDDYTHNELNNTTRHSHIRNNFTDIFRAMITDELIERIPLARGTVNNFFSNLNIPIEFDISYSNISINPYI